MTPAVCIKCGHEKLGALTRCPGCGFDPGKALRRGPVAPETDSPWRLLCTQSWPTGRARMRKTSKPWELDDDAGRS